MNRLAIIADYSEEKWPSMDLCADRLLHYLPVDFSAATIRPTMKRRLSRLLPGHAQDQLHILDRLINRQWDYPRYLKKRIRAEASDAYHIVDHSYAHLSEVLPACRTGIYCHDIDAFECLVEPGKSNRPLWFRLMSRRILKGLQAASVVFHNSKKTRDDLIRYNLVAPDKLIYAPLGVADEFVPEEQKREGVGTLQKIQAALNQLRGHPWILHVGSCIARKRIDLLLQVVAAARKPIPGLMLLKAGGEWGAEHKKLIADLGLEDAIIHLPNMERAELAECYRQASATLIPSDAEGFGLPVIEAMACGAPVIASDIPVLRESSGNLALFAPVGDIEAWVEQVERVLNNDPSVPARADRLAWASQFSWSEHARIIADAYRRIL
jgi:glycosyltransferase involved in cell wall biosynthesis